ncbi:N-terminal nucleophile aminohydrolase [Martensiomyces pterosporus]|nr:N-terminal nucleophile aminohydrolase [Martensiomyces pterosporus]
MHKNSNQTDEVASQSPKAHLRRFVRRVLRRSSEESQYLPSSHMHISGVSRRRNPSYDNGAGDRKKQTMGEKIRSMFHQPPSVDNHIPVSVPSIPQQSHSQPQRSNAQAQAPNCKMADACVAGKTGAHQSPDRFYLLNSISNIDLAQSLASFGLSALLADAAEPQPTAVQNQVCEVPIENSATTSSTSTSGSQTNREPTPDLPPTPLIAPAIIVHGGVLPNVQNLTHEMEKRIRRELRQAVESGYSALLNGGSAVGAVEAAVRRLEDIELSSAGRGAAVSALGHPLLDASICDGNKQQGAAVTLVSSVPNPISLARRILDHGSVSMVSSQTAQKYAELFKIKQVDPRLLTAEHRLQEYNRWRAASSVLDDVRTPDCGLDGPKDVANVSASASTAANVLGTIRTRVVATGNRDGRDDKRTTSTRPLSSGCGDCGDSGQISPANMYPNGGVGAVAVDQYGRVAAASSSGGSVGRLAGQISEAGCIGASTWADSVFAVSGLSSQDQCVGQQTAHTIALRARYRKEHLKVAAVGTLTDLLICTGADGAFIAIDNKGRFAITYSADNMLRGYCSNTTNHEPAIAIRSNEKVSSCDIHIT